MGVYTFTMADHTSPISPARYFKAFCIDNHNLMPKVAPQCFKSIDLVEGDPTSAGCVRQFSFPDGSPFKYVKNRVDELDLENFYIKYTGFEGSMIGDRLERVVHEGKAVPSGEGCQYILKAHFHTKVDAVMTEEHAQSGRETLKVIHEAIVKYLIDNPEAYA